MADHPGEFRHVPRLPLQPLLDELGLTVVNNGHHGGWAATLARLAGVTTTTVHRWRRAGGIPERHADVICCQVGLHIAIVWPETYDLESAA